MPFGDPLKAVCVWIHEVTWYPWGFSPVSEFLKAPSWNGGYMYPVLSVGCMKQCEHMLLHMLLKFSGTEMAATLSGSRTWPQATGGLLRVRERWFPYLCCWQWDSELVQNWGSPCQAKQLGSGCQIQHYHLPLDESAPFLGPDLPSACPVPGTNSG